MSAHAHVRPMASVGGSTATFAALNTSMYNTMGGPAGTAAMGMAMRAVGHGMRIAIVQFVKGVWETGERDVLAKFPDQVTIKAMGSALPTSSPASMPPTPSWGRFTGDGKQARGSIST